MQITQSKQNPDTTIYDFNCSIDRRNSDCEKWNKYSEDVLPMWVADMDFVSPEPVLNALRERIDHGVFGYPINPSGLRQLIVERMRSTYHWQIEPEDIILLPGVVTGLNLACHAIAKPAESVLVQTPVYPPILNAAKNTGIQGQDMQLTRQVDGTYSVDWDLFKASFTSITKLFILCNPHNPVGKVFTKSELEKIAELCLRNDAIICSDEIHSDLIFNGHTHTPIASIDREIAQCTITLNSPSKTFNLAGLRCSYAIIQNPELRKRYKKARAGLVSSVNVMGLTAAQAAYQSGEPWLKQLLVYLEANRNYLADFVSKELPGIEMGYPQGTYLAWLDCRRSGIEGNPYLFFLENSRVAFNDGETFGAGGQGFVRLNFGCSRATLSQALERLKQALISA